MPADPPGASSALCSAAPWGGRHPNPWGPQELPTRVAPRLAPGPWHTPGGGQMLISRSAMCTLGAGGPASVEYGPSHM